MGLYGFVLVTIRGTIQSDDCDLHRSLLPEEDLGKILASYKSDEFSLVDISFDGMMTMLRALYGNAALKKVRKLSQFTVSLFLHLEKVEETIYHFKVATVKKMLMSVKEN